MRMAKNIDYKNFDESTVDKKLGRHTSTNTFRSGVSNSNSFEGQITSNTGTSKTVTSNSM